jgi:chromate transport protein ChrA
MRVALVARSVVRFTVDEVFVSWFWLLGSFLALLACPVPSRHASVVTVSAVVVVVAIPLDVVPSVIRSDVYVTHRRLR